MNLLRPLRRLITSEAAIAAPALIRSRDPRERFVGAMPTRDIAIPFRMSAGFPGMLTRSHPMSVVARMPNAATPPLLYGIPVILVNDGTVRPFAPGDTGVTDPYGFTVRPYPMSPSGATNYGAINIGAGVPPTNFPIDVVVSGFIMSSVVGAPVPGGAVYVWCAASVGLHVQSGLEAVASGGNTAQITWDKTQYFSNADPSGNVEIGVNF